MRPTAVVSMLAGLLVAIVGGLLTVLVFVNHGDSGKPWHYWVAPLLVAGFASLLLALAAGYYVKVVRVETKGRQRR